MELLHVTTVVLAVCSVVMGTGWSYSGQNGPQYWKNDYPSCGGASQSPVNIIPADAEVSDDLDKFTFVGYDTTVASGQMTNTGHSVKVVVQASAGQIKLSGGDLTGDYILEQFHFHFGSNSSQGSEHQIDGESAALEVHFVHYRSDLGSVANALNYSDGLAVLGALFKMQSSNNTDLDPITNMLSNITYKDDSVNLNTSSLSLKSFLTSDLDSYYRYQGSLTTPPCSEAVVWTVFSTPNFISEAQLEKFRNLRSTKATETPQEFMQDNFRPTQPLNGRTVYRAAGDSDED